MERSRRRGVEGEDIFGWKVAVPQVRSRYPGVEALVRRDTLHLDSRRFLWGGQVSQASKKMLSIFFSPKGLSISQQCNTSRFSIRAKTILQNLAERTEFNIKYPAHLLNI